MLLSAVAGAVPELEEQGTRPAGNQPGSMDNPHADFLVLSVLRRHESSVYATA